MTTLQTTFTDFREAAGSFLKKVNENDYTHEQLEAGNKCVILSYLGIQDELTELQQHESVLLLDMCARPVTESLLRGLT